MNKPTKKQEEFVKAHGLSPKEYSKKAYWKAINDFINMKDELDDVDDLDYEYAIPLEETF